MDKLEFMQYLDNEFGQKNLRFKYNPKDELELCLMMMNISYNQKMHFYNFKEMLKNDSKLMGNFGFPSYSLIEKELEAKERKKEEMIFKKYQEKISKAKILFEDYEKILGQDDEIKEKLKSVEKSLEEFQKMHETLIIVSNKISIDN